MAYQTLQHEIGKRRPFDVPEEEAYLNLQRTAAHLAGPIAALFRSCGLSESTYNVLRILRGSGPAGRPCNEIGREMVVRVPDVTRLIDRLIGKKLVARERSTEDRRVVRVAITQRGLELLAELDAPLLELHRRQVGHLSPAELEQFNRLLVKARKSAEIPVPS